MIMKVSVRNLVEFVLAQGDLNPGSIGASRAQDAIKAHQYVQKTSGPDYVPEVTLSYLYTQQKDQSSGRDSEDIVLEIKGRADGIIKKPSGDCIDEIKTTYLDISLIEEALSDLHWAQVQCYAYIYAEREKLQEIETQLTYFQMDKGLIKRFNKTFSKVELSDFFINLVERYLTWATQLHEWAVLRDSSIRSMQFPYGAYRPGQRELAVAVYQTIKQGQRLFAQAPTGIGKTMGTIFPALKAMSEGLTEQVFYLTAKTITRTVAEKALKVMQEEGLSVKRLTLTAKAKLCFLPETTCLPEECPYAKGFFDRLRGAVEDMFSEEAWDRLRIEEYARRHSICPFEFSLEMANWADVVICDYNYVFDPRVYLRRFFQDGGEYAFLIDEAHNLVERAREMYSAELHKDPWLKLKRLTKIDAPRITKSITKVNSALLNEKKRCTESIRRSEIVDVEQPEKLIQLLRHFLKEVELYLKTGDQSVTWLDQLLELFFLALSFVRTADSYDERYVTFMTSTENDFRVKLFCLDPSTRLKEALGRGSAAVLFSATLSPLEYFMNVLGGEETSYKLKLASPFPIENLCLMINDRISTKFKHRSETYSDVAKTITASVAKKVGNYLVFFPSYDYLSEVYVRFREENQEIRIICQTTSMLEEQREEFLAQFTTNSELTLVGFALMGGIFGEGIDLIGDRLSGAIVVGVGLPQICTEREIIRNYYERNCHQGYEFAYMYPGFNKVLQAAGRVIRTEKDRGIVLLIDERFSLSSYKKLYPEEWKKVRYVNQEDSLKKMIQEFWSDSTLKFSD